MSPSADDLEIILLGTGTSGTLPNVACLVNHLAEKPLPPCRTCLSTLTPQGKHNIRRNTSAVVRSRRPDGSKSTILIDCGKSFLPSALEFFPKFGLRKIDAVLLTHPHADAINGLDDLRGWTLKGIVQPFIKVFLSAHTLAEIARSWPYMVEQGKATGGGDVPAFEWVVIDEEEDFEVEGVKVTPLNVHHGRFFDPPPLPTDPPVDPSLPKEIKPFYCLGFLFHPHIVYLADVSYIPEQVWGKLCPLSETKDATLQRALEAAAELQTPPLSPPMGPSAVGEEESTALSESSSPSSSSIPTPTTPYPSRTMGVRTPTSSTNSTAASNSAVDRPVPLLILDCLFLQTHPSHFGILSALSTVLRLRPLRTYLTGFAHHHSHDEWLALGAELAGVRPVGHEQAFIDRAMGLAGEVGEACRAEGAFVQPAFDGLRLVCDALGVREEEIEPLPIPSLAELGTTTTALSEATGGALVAAKRRAQVEVAHGEGLQEIFEERGRCCCP